MTLKQYFYSVVVTLIVLAVSLFALQNFQDVEVTIPFVGVFKTKLFVVIVFSFFSGFLTAGFLSLIFKIFSIPSNIKKKREKNVENRPVSKGSENSKEEESGKGTL
jgi:uncharacterized integral membrane protein